VSLRDSPGSPDWRVREQTEQVKKTAELGAWEQTVRKVNKK